MTGSVAFYIIITKSVLIYNIRISLTMGDHPTELWMGHNSKKTKDCLWTCFYVVLEVDFFFVRNGYLT